MFSFLYGKFVFKFVLKLAKNEFFEFYSYKVLKIIKKIKKIARFYMKGSQKHKRTLIVFYFHILFVSRFG